MKKLFLFPAILCASVSFAKNLTVQDLRERLEIRADVYMTDVSGEKIISGPEVTNYWKVNPEKGNIDGIWTSKMSAGPIIFSQKWIVADDATIHVTLEEFAEDLGRGHANPLKGSLEKKDFNLKNFEPVVWKVKNIKEQNFIVRFIPTLRDISKPIAVDNLPIAGTEIIVSDNEGFLWADNVEFNGRYSGLTSHRGTLAISYNSFPGAKEMGYAEGNQIVINVNKKYQISLRAASAFLPAGVTAKVYAIYNPDKKSKGFNSLHSFDTNKTDRLNEVTSK